MSLDRLRIAIGPLTGSIFAGYVNKNGTRWTQKRDMTHEMLGAVVEHALHRGAESGRIEVSKDGKPFATLLVQRVAPDTDMERAGQLTLTE